jgi:signal transduction histidine kinase
MKTILLLDDDESILSVFSMALRHHGYRVIEASSGDEGIELAKKHLPDLILSDISMPGKDGQAVLQTIRQHPELSTKQVVLMTGQTHLVTQRRGMELGADDFLVKPVSLGDLLRCVEARLERAQIHWRVEDRMLSKLRGTLRSNLPHELFTPLGGIIGLSDVLQADYANLSPEEIQDFLKDIHQSAMRLHRTLRNYLLMLDLEAVSEKGVTVTEQLLREEVERNLMSGIQTAIDYHKRAEDVVVHLETCGVVALPGDVSLIGEELVDNACKFSRKGTPIKIHFGTDAVLKITDEGRGMSSEEITQVGTFQQFDRKKHEQQGLGLGLALVQKLAAKCGATVSIESQLGQGTTVTIAFQAAKPAA